MELEENDNNQQLSESLWASSAALALVDKVNAFMQLMLLRLQLTTIQRFKGESKEQQGF